MLGEALVGYDKTIKKLVKFSIGQWMTLESAVVKIEEFI